MNGKVTTNQKLELVRSIRAQNQYNRNQCRERERFLYGYEPVTEKRQELYGAEMSVGISQDKGAAAYSAHDTGMLSGFRIRFVIAIIVFVLFVFFDRNQIEFWGTGMREIASCLTESIQITDALNSFDL